ncbi:hypothetical protein [Streptomyces smaragdinus]|uniref:hypothetical protein n=1 Tax=Streptomyces smaragdinus TaxID=2585196 RepID=UPI0012960613|nr:hypothetical protein [Streptomyces smaragdinus]
MAALNVVLWVLAVLMFLMALVPSSRWRALRAAFYPSASPYPDAFYVWNRCAMIGTSLSCVVFAVWTP